DPEQVASGIDQRAARIVGVYRRICLNIILVFIVGSETIASRCADDAQAHALANAEGVADGQYNIANLSFNRLSHGDWGEVIQLDLQYRNVIIRVGSYQGSSGLPAIVQQDDDFVRTADDMVIGQDMTFLAHNHARAKGGLHPHLLRGIGVIEQVAIERVVG